MSVNWTEAQLNAMNSRGRDVLVCAAAGSGKTATLTERIIRRLTDENDPADLSRMLIVTFTRNAAAELREKIYKALSLKLEQDPMNKAISLQLMKLPGARISTIHSFCFDIVKRNAKSLGLPENVVNESAPEIALRERRVMNDVVSDFYDREQKNTDSFDFVMLAASITGAKDEGSLAELFLDLYHSLCSYTGGARRLAEASGDYENVCKSEFFDTSYGKVYKREVIRKCEGLLEKYDAVIKSLNERYSTHPYHAALYSDTEILKRLISATDFGYAKVKSVVDSISYEKLGYVPKKDQCELCENAKELRSLFKNEVKKNFCVMFEYTSEELDDAAAKTATLSRTLSRVLCEFEDRFRQNKREAGVVDYNDLEYYALASLYDGEERSENAKRLSELIDEIYIDEYQDVNEVQDKIFSAVSNGKNTFMVGDVKQSIYGFRGGDPSIFTGRRDRYVEYSDDKEGDSPCTVFMQNNFRCDSTVIDFANAIFGVLLGRGGGRFKYIDEDALVYSKNDGVISESETLPRVVICEPDPRNESDSYDPEANFVADEIVRLLNQKEKPITPSDIAILLRSDKSSSEVFKRELERRGVPVQTTQKSSPIDNPEVELVLCILNAINNPHRDVYLAGALLSEVYRFTLDELTLIRRENPDAISLYDAVSRYAQAHGDGKCTAFIRENELYKTMAKSVSSDRLILHILTHTDIVRVACSRYSGTSEKIRAKKRCMLLYDYAREFERGSYKGLYSFVEYIEQMKADGITPELDDGYDDGCVRIMSMHAAKGLEFKVCFVSRTHKSFNKKDMALRLMYEPEIGIGFKLRSDDGYAVIDTPYRRAIGIYKRELAIEEEMRILYVALTRAGERLYVTSGVEKRGGSYERMEGKAVFGADTFSSTSISELSNFMDAILLSMKIAKTQVIPQREICYEHGKREMYSQQEDGEKAICETSEEEIRALAVELDKRIGYEYPFRKATEMRAKMSVSDLYPGVLDEDEEPREKDISFKARPRFLAEEESDSSAKKGTATHLIMQFADFNRLREHGAEAEIERLKREGFIDEVSASLVCIADIERFVESAFFKRILSADRLWREFRFNLTIPADKLALREKAKNALDGEQMLIQGVIDGFFLEGDNIVLFDYKTDYLTEYELDHPLAAKKKLSERHAQQLYYYKMALENVFSRRVDDVYIYSLPLGREVRVDITDDMIGETDKK